MIKLAGIAGQVIINVIDRGERKYVQSIGLYPADIDPWQVVKMQKAGNQINLPVVGNLSITSDELLIQPGEVMLVNIVQQSDLVDPRRESSRTAPAPGGRTSARPAPTGEDSPEEVSEDDDDGGPGGNLPAAAQVIVGNVEQPVGEATDRLANRGKRRH